MMLLRYYPIACSFTFIVTFKLIIILCLNINCANVHVSNALTLVRNILYVKAIL